MTLTGNAVLCVAAWALVLGHLAYARRRGTQAMGLQRWLALDGVVLLARLIFAGVFLVAAIGKLVNPVSFAETIYNFRFPGVLPLLALWLAAIFPGMELLGGCFMLLGVRTRAATLLLVGLLVGFTGGVLWAISQGIDISCGCLGHNDPSRTDWKKVLGNLALLAPAIDVLILGGGRLTLENLLRRLGGDRES